MGHPLGRLALLHPFPSALNALLVGVLSTVAGATAPTVLTLALAMLGFQVSIGALNDLVDAPMDAVVKPSRPIPSGSVSPRAAMMVVVGGGALGLACSLAVSPAAMLLGAAGYACGLAYDLGLKRRGLGWVAFTMAFPLLLLYAWVGAGVGLPPGWPLLLPLAALAGPALQVANGLTDLDDDLATGSDGLAVRLGRDRAMVVLTALTLLVNVLAWVAIVVADPSPASVAIALGASSVAAAGLVGSAVGTPRSTAWGWSLQAVGVASLAVAWMVAAA